MEPKNLDKNTLTFKNVIKILKGRQKLLNGFENKIYPIGKLTQGKGHLWPYAN